MCFGLNDNREVKVLFDVRKVAMQVSRTGKVTGLSMRMKR